MCKRARPECSEAFDCATVRARARLLSTSRMAYRWVSPLAQGRGSKRMPASRAHTRQVAPRAGAWIETSIAAPSVSDWDRDRRPSRRGVDRNQVCMHGPMYLQPRRPSRRGVDRNRFTASHCSSIASPLAQGRGSKPAWATAHRDGALVAPRAGAWIETLNPRVRSRWVAPRAGSAGSGVRGGQVSPIGLASAHVHASPARAAGVLATGYRPVSRMLVESVRGRSAQGVVDRLRARHESKTRRTLARGVDRATRARIRLSPRSLLTTVWRD